LAPTPSGLLHIGNAASFVLTWLLARAHSGKILLRIDDLDRSRFRMAYLEDIFYTIDWLGIDYDEGPSGVSDFLLQYSQHRRLDLYEEALHQLQESALLYGCSCSRKRIREAAGPGQYDGYCREAGLPLETGVVWRVRMPDSCVVPYRAWGYEDCQQLNVSALMRDFVVRQRDGLPAYQVASLCDDEYWGIDMVVRGQDLLPSTGAQVWLSSYLSECGFRDTVFYHHPLLLDAGGEKLSKSAGSASLWAMRAAGLGPESVYRRVAEWLCIPEAYSASLSDMLTYMTSGR
jgi:glutamyl-tRNA synthetase